MKKLSLMLIVLVFLIPIALADVDYTESGQAIVSGEEGNFYVRGSGVFNSQLNPADTTFNSKVLSDPEQVPLIKDIDGDGVVEIFVINAENILAIQNKTLQTAGVFPLNASAGDTFSNMIIFDIDGDGIDEIIVASEFGESLHILNYNRSVFTATSLSLKSLTHNNGKITIGCESANRCIMQYAEENLVGAGDIAITFFNSTFVGNELITGSTIPLTLVCPPKIRHMATADYDLDGDVEFMFSTIGINTAIGDSGESYSVNYVNVLPNNTIDVEGTSSIGGSDVDEIFAGGSSFSCDNQAGLNGFRFSGGLAPAIPGNFMTSPLVYDADPDELGLETIVGYMKDNNEFKIRMFKPDRTKNRDFPLVQDSEGQIIGNVFRAEIFDDSDSKQDFCVIAQDVTEQDQIAVTCGSLQDTNGVGLFNTQSIEFRGSGLADFNSTLDYSHWGMLAHAVDYDNSNSVSEISTTFGILEPVFSGFLCAFGIDAVDCPLDLIFNMPSLLHDGTVLPVDLDGNNLEDLLILTQTNLHYLDDGFTNQPVNAFCGEPGSVSGTCSTLVTNPCLDSVWKINTSVEIIVTAKDPESDLVQVSATLYDGDSNEQSQTSANVSSGTTVPFSFVANKTIGAGVLTVTAVDIQENPVDVETITKSFSVAPVGVEFNDCTSTFEVGVDVVAEVDGIVEDATLTIDATENAITTGVQTFVDRTNIGGTTIWLILMLAFSLGIWFMMAERGLSGNSALGTVFIVNVLFILIGTRLEILSTALVTIIVVIGVIIAGITLTSFLFGARQQAQ